MPSKPVVKAFAQCTFNFEKYTGGEKDTLNVKIQLSLSLKLFKSKEYPLNTDVSKGCFVFLSEIRSVIPLFIRFVGI